MKDPIKLWTDICKRFALQSKCLSRSVGCIIVKNDILIGEGWNGAPQGSICSDCERCKGEYKSGEKLDLAICSHAESNAIGNCAKNGHSTNGSIMYCTHFCCRYCANLIISSGIKEYYYIDYYYYPGHENTIELLLKANVKVEKLII